MARQNFGLDNCMVIHSYGLIIINNETVLQQMEEFLITCY